MSYLKASPIPIPEPGDQSMRHGHTKTCQQTNAILDTDQRRRQYRIRNGAFDIRYVPREVLLPPLLPKVLEAFPLFSFLLINNNNRCRVAQKINHCHPEREPMISALQLPIRFSSDQT